RRIHLACCFQLHRASEQRGFAAWRVIETEFLGKVARSLRGAALQVRVGCLGEGPLAGVVRTAGPLLLARRGGGAQPRPPRSAGRQYSQAYSGRTESGDVAASWLYAAAAAASTASTLRSVSHSRSWSSTPIAKPRVRASPKTVLLIRAHSALPGRAKRPSRP